MYYYEIYVENGKYLYTYKSKEKYEIGQWCIINFINRNKMGLIIAETKEENITFDVSKIKYIIDKAPILSVPLTIINLTKWIKDYYLSDYYNVIKAVYPGSLKLNYSKKVIYNKELEVEKLKDERVLFNSVEIENKVKEIEKFNEYMMKKKEVTYNTLKKYFSKEIIEEAEKKKAITIEKKLIVNENKKKIEKIKSEILENKVTLNDEQQNALNIIKNGEKQFYLLKGVTGSGKTEIYINLMKEALQQGKGSIFLVPEISLTTQMIERLEKQFKDTIAVLHSKLTDLEKRQEWNYIRNGDKKIVIGARSAIFAPVQNLKYIIIDEEHENTYKQDNNPRYHVKNVAIKRAMLESGEEKNNNNEKVKVILGSATPSFESYYQAKTGDLSLVELKQRFNNAKMPKYEIVDLNETSENFSKELLKQMAETLKKQEQILLILNRKAFSTLLKCKDCGEIPTCPNCSISLSYYKSENRLKCNYCGYERLYQKKCFNCGSEKLIQLGSGTEKIEAELHEYFPSTKIVRIDSESMKNKQDYEKVYSDFKNHKYDIMIGTQIIAKGFHFPNVTLVGILNSDIILNFPDFRAGEKTFQLLTQSAGRAGRGEKEGKVLIQTFNMKNEVIQKTIENNYEGYYEHELQMRRLLNYPPFGRLIVIVLSSKDELKLENKTKEFYEILQQNIRQVINVYENEMLSEPFKAPIYKINGRYRNQIFIKFNRENINKIKKIIRQIVNKLDYKDVRISIDVDPINMM